jgi:hypothetical protein
MIPYCGIQTSSQATTTKQTTRQQSLLGSGPGATREVLLEAVFSMWYDPRLYHATDRLSEIVENIRGLNLAVVKPTTVQVTKLPL